MDKIVMAADAPVNRRTLAALVLSMLLAALGTSIANIALPTIAQAFDAPFQSVQWVVVSYLAALTLSSVFAGRLGDRFGLRRMHLAGLALFTLASLACALAPALWLLIVARAAQGVGAAFLMTLTLALLRETSAPARMGRAMGLLGTVSAVGTGLGPSLGGLLIPVAGWSGIFHLLAAAGLATLLAAARFLPRGAAAAASTPLRLASLRDGPLLSGLAANLLVCAVMMTTLVAGPFYLRIGLGLGAAAAGIVMSLGPVISSFAGVLSGRAVDAWGTRRITMVGLSMLSAGAFAVAILPQFSGLVGYVFAVAILSPGYQLFQAANNTAIMAGASAEERGVVSGTLNLSRNLGLVLGAWAMGAVFALGVGTGDFGSATPGALGRGLLVVFGLSGLLMGLALWIVRRSAGEPRES